MQAHGMVFCNKCRNMLYIKTNKEEHTLCYYCKNCGEEYPETVGSSLIYDKQYQSDSAALRYENNNYLVYDVSIPHLVMNCVNTNCITNSSCKMYIAFNYHNNITNIEEQNALVLKTFQTQQKKPYDFKIDHYQFKNVISLIVKDTKTSYIKMFKLFHTFLQENKELYNINVIQDIEEAQKDVLFIKYDYKNLKYLYKCCNCFTTWKNK